MIPDYFMENVFGFEIMSTIIIKTPVQSIISQIHWIFNLSFGS